MITQVWTSYARDGGKLDAVANKQLRWIHENGGTVVSVKQEVVVRHKDTVFVVFIQFQMPADAGGAPEPITDPEPLGGVS